MAHVSNREVANDQSDRKDNDIAAPVDRVWRALTDHTEFGEWFRAKLEGPTGAAKPCA